MKETIKLEKLINKENVCSITIYRKLKCRDYKFYKGINKWYKKQKEGFYFVFVLHGMEYCPNDVILSKSNLLIENETVYYKPHLDFKMTNGEVITKYFNNELELNSFINMPLMQESKWIVIK